MNSKWFNKKKNIVMIVVSEDSSILHGKQTYKTVGALSLNFGFFLSFKASTS